MKIAFNPSTVAALITPPNNKDITFDLRGRNIFARGVKFCGTDTWRDIKINNVSIGSNILDLRNGSNTTLTNTNGVVTINSTWRPVVDNLTSDSTTSSLSAKQGKVLKSLIDGKSNSGHNHDNRYLKLTGGTMQLGEGLKFHADENYFGTNSDARIISLLDWNDKICDGGLIIDERGTLDGKEYVTELLRIRDSEFKWRGNNILHSGNTYVNNNKGYIYGNEITLVNNADTIDGYHASSLVKFYLSPMTSNAPADSAKNWFVDTMPSASGAIVYNVPGSEKTIIAGKSSGAYGHMLQLNYDDNYLRMLRYRGGSWKSTDWEKISAGYADSAGSVAWDNVTGKPLSYIPSAHTHSWTSITDKLVAGNEFNIANAGFNGDIWLNYVPINDRSKTATVSSYIFGNGHKGLALVLASGFVKTGSSSSYVLLGDGDHKTISSLSVNYASSAGNADTLDGNHASAFATVEHTHSNYVTALGTNDNYLTWTKNGSTNNITVPYATTSSYLTNGFSATWVNKWDCNAPDRVVYSDYGSSGRSIANAPSGWLYGTLLELGHTNYRGINGVLNILLMWDVAHNTTLPGTLWFRGKDEVNGWAKSWAKVITDLNISSILSNYYTKSETDGKYVTLTTTLTIGGSKTFTTGIKFNTNKNGDANLGSGDGFKLFYNETSGSNFPGSYYNVASFMTGYTGFLLACYGGSDLYLKYRHRLDNGTWHPWKTLAFTTDIPSSLKNPYSLTTFGVVYDGSAAKVVTTSTFISLVNEATAIVTDGTMFITSYASNSGFADTNAVNVPYKRKAIHLWNYIKTKTDSIYATNGHNHDDRYLKLTGGIMTGTIRFNNLISIDSAIVLDYKYSAGGFARDIVSMKNSVYGDANLGALSILCYPNSTSNGFLYIYLGTDKYDGLNNLRIYKDKVTFGDHLLIDAGNYSSILDSRYYTESEVNNLLSNKLNTSDFNWTNLKDKPNTVQGYGISNALIVSYDGNNYVNASMPSSQLSNLAGQYYIECWDREGGWWNWMAGKFMKAGSSDSYVLLGGGGHKAESSLRVAYASSAGNADTVDGVHLSGIFTAFGNNAHNITATIGGVTKSFLVNWAADSDKLDGYHENSFLRYRETTSIDLENTLWDLIGIKLYNGALPDNLTNVYNYGSVISLPCTSTRFEIYASELASLGNGLYYRSGWRDTKRPWLKFIDSSNIGSQSVNYANSAGNADKLDGIHANGLLTALSNSNNGISITVGGTTKSVSNISVNYASSAGSATKVIVNLHTTNDTNYPLVWSNLSNTNSVTENQLYKSWSDLYYNPKNKRLTVGGSVVASSFVKRGGTSLQLLRADGGIAAFNWSGQSGLPTWLWGGNNEHSYYVYNPSNFRVAYATSAGSADTALYLRSLGNLNCQTGRTLNYGDVYTYNTYDGNTGSPTTFTSVIGFGRGIAGTVEIAGGWDNTNLYWRSLRDCCENWHSWRTVLDSSNYTEFINNYYWANVKISTSSSTTTSPTVSNLTATSSIRIGSTLSIKDSVISCSASNISIESKESGSLLINSRQVLRYDLDSIDISNKTSFANRLGLTTGILGINYSTDDVTVLIGSLRESSFFEFRPAMDGLLLFLKVGKLYSNTNFWCTTKNCEVIKANNFGTYLARNSRKDCFGDGEARIFIYKLITESWYEFYCG